MAKRTPLNHYKTKVTPKLAKEWLERNTHNRPVRPAHVEQLAKSILFDEWQLNGDAIRFDYNDNVLDGQHRLHAVILADKPIDSFVIEGLPPQAQETMDMGRKRLLSDVLHLRGETNTIVLAATINSLYRWEHGRMHGSSGGTSNNPTVGEAIQLLEERGDDIRRAVRSASKVANRLPISTTTVAACWLKFSDLDEEDCRDFWAAVTTGFHLNGDAALANSGPYALSRYIQRNAQGHKKVPQHVLHALIIKAWNAYRRNQAVNNLSWRPGGSRPEPFPEVV